MQGRDGRRRIHLRPHTVVDDDGVGEVRPAVHDAVAGRADIRVLRDESEHRVDHRLLCRVTELQRGDGLLAVPDDAQLQAARAGVDHENLHR